MKESSDYIKALRTVSKEGHWIENKRTGVKCLTKINIDLTYHVDRGELPLDTTRKSFWKPAIAELLGYIRGYTDAKQFSDLGAKTWFANANENKAWLENRFRTGENDMGIVYGAVGNSWPKLGIPNGGDSLMLSGHLDLLENIVNDLKNGIDDRGEIWSFWNPGMFQLGCLRPCMYSHHFSLVDGTLYLNSTQRSADLCLGLNFNAVQCYVLLALIAQITGHNPGKAYHKVVNGHIYENQYRIMLDSGHLEREEYPFPKLKINPNIKTLEDLRTWVTLSDFEVIEYQHHDAIKYPFTV